MSPLVHGRAVTLQLKRNKVKFDSYLILNSTIIDEHVTLWGPTLKPGSQDSFEGRLAIIKNELVVRRDQIYKDEQKAQRA